MPNEEGTVVNEAVVADTTQDESTTSENVSSEVVEDGEYTSQDIETEGMTEEEEAEDSEADKEENAEETEDSPKPRGKAEERKQQLNNEIRDLVAQRNTLKEEVERINSQVYQPATEDEMLEQVNPETGEYYNRVEAKLAILEQRQELERYNNQVAEQRLTLASEAEQALKDFPMFDANNKDEYNPDVAKQVDELLGANLVFDPNTGALIGSRISPYQLYATVANSAQATAQVAQTRAQRATEKMMSNADVVTGGQGQQKPFHKLSTKEMQAELRKKGYDV